MHVGLLEFEKVDCLCELDVAFYVGNSPQNTSFATFMAGGRSNFGPFYYGLELLVGWLETASDHSPSRNGV